MVTTLQLTRPDDWHLHLRDGKMLTDIVPATGRRFARAIIMPNLRPPITTTTQALAYRKRILAAQPKNLDFEPLMTLYLTDNTIPEEITRARDSGHIYAVKLYPAGATTNADFGVTCLHKLYPVLEALQQQQLPLLIHGEVTDPAVDIFDRERVFIESHLIPLLHDFPALRVVLEHITTQEAVDFIEAAPPNIAATITPHHLLFNRNALLAGGIQPHYYCLPVLKREIHRQALVAAATSGNPKFFLGTDSAPHAKTAKETACGCAGIYSSHAALELYAEAFEEASALEKLEAFASFHGPDFYGLPRNQDTVTLIKTPWQVPESLPYGDDALIPLRGGTTVAWRLAE
ncbi:dihydroorotase [Nitrosococcus oceani ATCC 19707]|uniref:Dihydroorotase n=2 Tax=Nitrosococcus oceani TaxID=1229 RepID=PYRC_NITOC|nr:dihydroorotase [Nitrosococcus oceani]Q3J872.1 RecName: Full=Dihydroorotase; Short=DHOase [Nitrosococcus oceani ATCC 19707]KFI18596.1 dihydroorotase [Nitrosococcus oceani C-27]ABA58974.1 dihydroorotase [Nitrosococcus oceani ATCC 19707]EDZ65302.1 dihydroorotase, homodimeric type [Nitrosococcus oceani AFC27]GEM18930.1 dihydroorotase [Nitrosococcus oceani]